MTVHLGLGCTYETSALLVFLESGHNCGVLRAGFEITMNVLSCDRARFRARSKILSCTNREIVHDFFRDFEPWMRLR